MIFGDTSSFVSFSKSPTFSCHCSSFPASSCTSLARPGLITSINLTSVRAGDLGWYLLNSLRHASAPFISGTPRTIVIASSIAERPIKSYSSIDSFLYCGSVDSKLANVISSLTPTHFSRSSYAFPFAAFVASLIWKAKSANSDSPPLNFDTREKLFSGSSLLLSSGASVGCTAAVCVDCACRIACIVDWTVAAIMFCSCVPSRVAMVDLEPKLSYHVQMKAN